MIHRFGQPHGEPQIAGGAVGSQWNSTERVDDGFIAAPPPQFGVFVIGIDSVVQHDMQSGFESLFDQDLRQVGGQPISTSSPDNGRASNQRVPVFAAPLKLMQSRFQRQQGEGSFAFFAPHDTGTSRRAGSGQGVANGRGFRTDRLHIVARCEQAERNSSFQFFDQLVGRHVAKCQAQVQQITLDGIESLARFQQ